jgi:hypothetical protein
LRELVSVGASVMEMAVSGSSDRFSADTDSKRDADRNLSKSHRQTFDLGLGHLCYCSGHIGDLGPP